MTGITDAELESWQGRADDAGRLARALKESRLGREARKEQVRVAFERADALQSKLDRIAAEARRVADGHDSTAFHVSFAHRIAAIIGEE